MIRIGLTALLLMAGLHGVTARPLARAAPPPEPLAQSKTPCPELGPGFVRAPGTNTCVKVGGSVGVETRVGRSFN